MIILVNTHQGRCSHRLRNGIITVRLVNVFTPKLYCGEYKNVKKTVEYKDENILQFISTRKHYTYKSETLKRRLKIICKLNCLSMFDDIFLHLLYFYISYLFSLFNEHRNYV